MGFSEFGKGSFDIDKIKRQETSEGLTGSNRTNPKIKSVEEIVQFSRDINDFLESSHDTIDTLLNDPAAYKRAQFEAMQSKPTKGRRLLGKLKGLKKEDINP